ncbi:MAG: HD domain-containing protein [Nanoarchaeota archaeon]|nr:HD domain-containing protein [Nanoarchaeota archaeon]
MKDKIKYEQKAEEFAMKAHKGQYRLDGKTTYIEHPRNVARLLKEAGIKDENILCAAWLHDVVEDCGIEIERIGREFNMEIARIVFALTRDKTRSREEYIKKIKNSDFAVQIVKLADVSHNLMTLHKDVPENTVRNIINDCNSFYFGLARKISPTFYNLLQTYLDSYRIMQKQEVQLAWKR